MDEVEDQRKILKLNQFLLKSVPRKYIAYIKMNIDPKTKVIYF